MFFKNLNLYRLEHWPGDDFEPELEQYRAKPCGKLEPLSVGLASPFGPEHEALLHSANGCALMRYATYERVLPPAVVRDQIAERARAFAARTGHPPKRRDKLQLKDEVVHELLPQAFVKPGHVDFYIDPQAGYLMADTSSTKTAEDIATLMRQVVPDARLRPVDAANRILTHLTHWVETGRCAGKFGLGDQVELRDDRDAGAVTRCRKQDLTAPEVAAHLKAGKRVSRLGLVWDERLEFVVNEQFALAAIKPLEVIADTLSDLPGEDAAQRLDSEFAFMSLEFRALVGELESALEVHPGAR